jgi:AcrR family transcriptional regulator
MSMSAASLRRRAEIGQERRQRTQQKLIEAAARVVAARGEAHATIDDFISEARVARGTFYNHFATREALLEALWAYIGVNPFRAIQATCSALPDPAESLAAEARLVLHQSSRDPVWGWLVYYLSSGSDTLNDDLRAYPRDILRRGRAQGRFVFDTIESASDLVVSAVRIAMQGVLTGARDVANAEDVCVLFLVALGLSREESRKVVSRALPTIGAKRGPALADRFSREASN